MLDSSINDVQDLTVAPATSPRSVRPGCDRRAVARRPPSPSRAASRTSRRSSSNSELDIQRETAPPGKPRLGRGRRGPPSWGKPARRRVQVEKDNEVAAQQPLRDTELDAEVRRPAEAELYAAQQRAAAKKAEITAEAGGPRRGHPHHR